MAAPYEELKTQKDWEVYIKALLKDNTKALLRAIVLVYDNQTDEEKAMAESVEENNIGFTKWDAKELSAVARKIKAREPLSDAELARARNKMGKYWRQLMVISKRNIEHAEAEKKAAELAAAHESFRAAQEAIRCCAEEGKPCEYGICDECIVTRGLQMHL